MRSLKERYQNPALDALLHSSFEENEAQVKNEAKSFGLKNLPRSVNDRMNSYFEEVHLRCQALIDKVNSELQFETTCHEAREHIVISNRKTASLQNKLDEAHERKIRVDSKWKTVNKPLNLIRLIFAKFSVALISSFEAIFTIPVFESMGFSLLHACILGIIFSGVITIIAHLFLKIISLGKTLLQRRLIAVALSSLVCIFFLYIANIRAELISNSLNIDGTSNIHFSPLPFFFTSVLLFTVAVALCHFYMPSKAQKDAFEEYKKLKKEKKKLESRITAIESHIETIQLSSSEVTNLSASILVCGNMLEESIINNAKRCYVIWRKYNQMHRIDNNRPSCFDDPYPFVFKTYFHAVKSVNYEKEVLS